MTILPIYAALLALLFIVLSVRTLRLRKRLKIAVGDAGDKTMLRAMRVHANFAEYVPLALLLLAMIELRGAPGWMVHALGTALLLGRLSHAWGVSQDRERFGFRVFGMATTLGTITVAAVSLLLGAMR
jgi:uncharacterized membrane protein YecN with MAPEG domain